MAPHHPQSSFPCFTGQQSTRFLLTPKLFGSLLYTESFTHILPTRVMKVRRSGSTSTPSLGRANFPPFSPAYSTGHSTLSVILQSMSSTCSFNTFYTYLCLEHSFLTWLHDCVNFFKECHFTKKDFPN